MITSSILRIYTDKFCTNLHETVNVVGSTLQADTSTLLPGKAYWATVEVTDSVAGQSAESAPYKFYSLPNIVLSGSVVIESNSFTRPTTITTDIVGVVDHGFLVTDDPNWATRPVKVSGNTVTGLEEHTIYYYCPWVQDEFGRTYVNYDDVDSVITEHSVPLVKITETYTPTSTTFSGKIDVYSSTALSAVWLETVSGGTTITTQLVAQTGEQPFTVEGLTPFTKYHLTAYATNTAGTGESQTVYFTTAQAEPTPVSDIQVTVKNTKVSSVNNTIKTTSFAEYTENVTVASHKVYVYDNSEHNGEPVVEYNGGAADGITAQFAGSNFDCDTRYFIFGYVTYTDGEVEEPYELWSEPDGVRTYSLVTIDSISAARTSLTVTFSVDGYSSDTVLEYSLNQETWRRAPVEDPQGGNAIISGLTPNTTYYIRMRVANSEGEYCDYVTDDATTTTTTVAITGFARDNNSIDVGIAITTA